MTSKHNVFTFKLKNNVNGLKEITLQWLHPSWQIFLCFRIAKISHTGLIEVGKRADLVLFDRELNLLNTLVFGQVLFQKT